jgi:hypothetical protein
MQTNVNNHWIWCWGLLLAVGPVWRGFRGGVELYLGSIIMIEIYSTLSAAIGGRDGMDGGRVLWM